MFGQSVTFTATVSSGSGTPTGTVQFKDGAANVGAPVALVDGAADLATAGLAVGSHSITGVYSGDPNFSTSTSVALAHTVAKASTDDRDHGGRAGPVERGPGLRWCSGR